jgi:hypothetical protein
LTGYQQGYLDNTDNTKAFQQGYTNGYNQAVIDLSKPRVPQTATVPMQQAQIKQEEEPTEHDNRHSNAHWQSRQSIDQLYAGINAD